MEVFLQLNDHLALQPLFKDFQYRLLLLPTPTWFVQLCDNPQVVSYAPLNKPISWCIYTFKTYLNWYHEPSCGWMLNYACLRSFSNGARQVAAGNGRQPNADRRPGSHCITGCCLKLWFEKAWHWCKCTPTVVPDCIHILQRLQPYIRKTN